MLVKDCKVVIQGILSCIDFTIKIRCIINYIHHHLNKKAKKLQSHKKGQRKSREMVCQQKSQSHKKRPKKSKEMGCQKKSGGYFKQKSCKREFVYIKKGRHHCKRNTKVLDCFSDSVRASEDDFIKAKVATSTESDQHTTDIKKISLKSAAQKDVDKDKRSQAVKEHLSLFCSQYEIKNDKKNEKEKERMNIDKISVDLKELHRNLNIKPIFQVYYQYGVELHPHQIDDIPWPWMKEEKWRLHTFCKYPQKASKSAILLAANGFAYIGLGIDLDDSVICYFCQVRHKNWELKDNIGQVHASLKPSCSLVTGKNCDNVPMSHPVRGNALFSVLSPNQDKSNHEDIQADGDMPTLAENRGQSQHVIQQTSTSKPVGANIPTRSSEVQNGLGMSRGNQSATQGSTASRPMQLAQQSVRREGTRSTNVQQSRPSNEVFVTAHQVSNPNASSTTITSNTVGMSSLPISGSGVPGDTARTQTQNDSATLNHSENSQVTESSNHNSQGDATSSASSTPNATVPSAPTPNPAPTQASNPAPPPAPAPAPTSAPNPTAPPAPQTQTAVNAPNNGQREPAPTRPNESGSRGYANLGIITERPKRFEYALKVSRVRSFDGWPQNHHLTVDKLADAGFYYAGYGDCARCFYCGGGLRNWESNDDVWVEHARWFPKCAFLQQTVGRAFVDAVRHLNRDNENISYQDVLNKMGVQPDFLTSKENSLKRDAAVIAVTNLGFEEKDACEGAQALKDSGVALSADKLFEKLKSDNKPLKATEAVIQTSNSVSGGNNVTKDLETISNLKEQNSQLRAQTVCKICMDVEVSVVFLPCGHFVSCSECAAALQDCPVCRQPVRGLVKATIS